MLEPKDARIGQLVLYRRDPDDPSCPTEIGVIKKIRDNGCFVAYHLGDTTAMTRWENLFPIENEYAILGLTQRSEQLGRTWQRLYADVEDWSQD